MYEAHLYREEGSIQEAGAKRRVGLVIAVRIILFSEFSLWCELLSVKSTLHSLEKVSRQRIENLTKPFMIECKANLAFSADNA